VSVVHENCCKPILTIENNKKKRTNKESKYKMNPVAGE
jgi:hypothetical protein